MFGDVEVDDAPAVVSEHDEAEEDVQAGGGHGEEVDRDQIPDMVVEEGAPGLRRLGPPFRHEAGRSALSCVDAELYDLAMDAGGTPEGVRSGHAGDESLDLGFDGRATSGRAARELGLIVAEAAPLPSQDGVGGHDHDETASTRPRSWLPPRR